MMTLTPAKHIALGETILGVGARVLSHIQHNDLTLDEVWRALHDIKREKRPLPLKIAFEDLVLTIDFLYITGLVHMTDNGKLSICG